MDIFQAVYDTLGIWKDESEKCLLGRSFAEFVAEAILRRWVYFKLTIANV
jgi:hypothetical protein